MTSLEDIGMTYNPFSTTNVWGNKNSLHLKGLSTNDLPVGNDVSAFPRLATDPRLQVDVIQGSGVAPSVDNTPGKHNLEQEQTKTAILIVVLAVAFLWTRS